MSSTESSRLPQDEDARIIEEVQRRKLDRKKAMGYEQQQGRSSSPDVTTGTRGDVTDRGRRKDKSPIGMRYRSRSPSPVQRNLRTGRSRSPPPRATAPIEIMHDRHEYEREQGMRTGMRKHFDVGYTVQLPTGGPVSESPTSSPSVSSPSSAESMSPSPKVPKETTMAKVRHPLEPTHGKMKKKRPLGLRTIDLDTRVARVGKHGENIHYITFGKLQVRLIRGKNLPKNGIMSVCFYLPTPSVKTHAHPFGTSREIRRVENYLFDETFTTKVELETKENALEIVRNLVVHLRYISPHIRRNLGDMEGTVDVSEMIRSSTPLHTSIIKLPLFPTGPHKKRRESAVDEKYRPKLYLEVLWRPNDAFRHSFASLLEDYHTSLRGLKTKNWRLNVAGFAPYGTSYGLIWLQNIAQSWIEAMGEVVDVVNVTSSVQPGPFSGTGRSEIWEAVVSVWFRIDEGKLRSYAQRELEVLESRERELEERYRRRSHGFAPSALPGVQQQQQQQQQPHLLSQGTSGRESMSGVGVGGGAVSDRTGERLPGMTGTSTSSSTATQRYRRGDEDDIEAGAD